MQLASYEQMPRFQKQGWEPRFRRGAIGMSIVFALLFSASYLGVFEGRREALEERMAQRRLLHYETQSLTAGTTILSSEAADTNSSAPKPSHNPLSLFGPTCDSGFDRYGGGFVLLVGLLYCFLALAIICEDFFVGSLLKISEYFQLSEDVAGATFMAAGSSAPELISATLGVLVTKSEVGLGVVVGSCIYNTFAICGLSAYYLPKPTLLFLFPLVRDGFFYFLSVVLIYVGFRDGFVTFWEAMLLLAGYALYIWTLSRSRLCHVGTAIIYPEAEEQYQQVLEAKMLVDKKKKKDEIAHSRENIEEKHAENQTELSTVEMQMDPEEAKRAEEFVEDMKTPGPGPDQQRFDEDRKSEVSVSVSVAVANINPEIQEIAEAKFHPELGVKTVPEVHHQSKGITRYLAMPLIFIYSRTIPSCKDEKVPGIRTAGVFVMALTWMTFWCYFMVEFGTHIACIIGIDDRLMGVTLLAAGTSFPDTISSIVVAKQGQGGMAISNALGSNIFDLLFCLGIPYAIYGLYNDGVVVEAEAIGVNIGWMILSLLIIICALRIDNLRLTKRLGYSLLFCYSLFVLFCILEAGGAIKLS